MICSCSLQTGYHRLPVGWHPGILMASKTWRKQLLNTENSCSPAALQATALPPRRKNKLCHKSSATWNTWRGGACQARVVPSTALATSRGRLSQKMDLVNLVTLTATAQRLQIAVRSTCLEKCVHFQQFDGWYSTELETVPKMVPSNFINPDVIFHQ